MDQTDKPLVVVADDDPDLLDIMEYYLSDWGYEVACAQDKQQLFTILTHHDVDLVLLDLHFGEHDGIDVLSQLSSDRFEPPVVVLTAYGSIGAAVQATKLGAYEFLTKPPDLERLRSVAARAVEKYVLRKQARAAVTVPSASKLCSRPMLGAGRAMQSVRDTIREVAQTDAKVLILGESGTGKELVARAIHEQGRRANQRFIPVNMAALPPGLAESNLFGHEKGSFTSADATRKGWCEMADQGTLFLDEIGEMDLSLQAKLLRFLQDQTFQRVGSSESRTVDVRIISATNREPEEMLREGFLREDLYYRLNVIPIVMPPLRDRVEDIPLLATWFLEQAANRHNRPVRQLTDAAIGALQSYEWPGNVRQLENLIEQTVILSRGPCVGVESLPKQIFSTGLSQQGGTDYKVWPEEESDGLRAIDRIEKQAMLEALAKASGNVVAAADLLGVGQATVYRKIKRYGITLKRGRSRAVSAI